MKISRELLLEVRGMMERKWDYVEIANKLNINVDDVRIMVDLINNLLT